MIPIFNAIISSEAEGILKISLVDMPAVESNWIAMAEDKKPLKFSVQDEDKHLITGVVMRADFPIYRYNEQMGEYYIRYSKDTIRLMAEKMLFDNNQNNINLQHTDGTDVDGVNLIELFIKDTDKGINPSGFDDIEDGSLFATYKVENDEVWQSIKDGTFQGFSLEGYFSLQETSEYVKNNKTNKRSKMSKLKEALKSLLQEFGSINTDKGNLEYEGELEVGTEVTIDGAAAEDGEYKTEDKVIVVAEGKVTEIREIEVVEETPEEEVVVEAKSLFRRMAEKFAEESYQEKEQKIIDAIKALGVEYPYLVEASDEYAIVCVWNEDGEKYFKYEISWNEDGDAVIGGMSEVENAFVPVEEEAPVAEEAPVVEENMAEEEAPATEEAPAEETPAEEERDLAAEIDALKEELAKIKELVDSVIKEPAQAPIVEEFEAIKKETKTGDAKLDRAINRFSKLK